MPESRSLRERREALSWTLAYLAGKAGVSLSYVSMIERRGRVGGTERGKRDGEGAIARIRAALEAGEAAQSNFQALEAKIAASRALADAMPKSPEWDALRLAIGHRAIEVLDGGNPEACDLLLEFLPEPQVSALLDAYFSEEASDA